MVRGALDVELDWTDLGRCFPFSLSVLPWCILEISYYTTVFLYVPSSIYRSNQPRQTSQASSFFSASNSFCFWVLFSRFSVMINSHMITLTFQTELLGSKYIPFQQLYCTSILATRELSFRSSIYTSGLCSEPLKTTESFALDDISCVLSMSKFC